MSRLLLGLVGAIFGAALTRAVIYSVVSYQIPGSLLLASGMVAVLIVGGAAVIWPRLPRLRPAAVGLLLGTLAYVVIVGWIVVTSVIAFERMG